MSGKYYVTEPHEKIEIKLTNSGYGSRAPTTVVNVFQDTVKKHGSRPALALKRAENGGKLPEDWKFWTWKDYYSDCEVFAKSLIHFKVDSFKIVNILGFNSPEWFIANTGSILAGCIAAGIYTTNTADACLYISEHSKAGKSFTY
jgi:long-chain-fatty-acid--CoA ligase ACSBG